MIMKEKASLSIMIRDDKLCSLSVLQCGFTQVGFVMQTVRSVPSRRLQCPWVLKSFPPTSTLWRGKFRSSNLQYVQTFMHRVIAPYRNTNVKYSIIIGKMFRCILPNLVKACPWDKMPKPRYKCQVNFMKYSFLTKQWQYGFWMYYCDKCVVFHT